MGNSDFTLQDVPMTWCQITLVALFFSGACAPAAGAAETPAINQNDARNMVLSQLQPGMEIEQFVKNVNETIGRADIDNDGIDKQDVAFERQRVTAEKRSNVGRVLFTYDLDANGRVTPEEFETMKRWRRMERDFMGEQLRSADANHDGTVTIDEVMTMRFCNARPTQAARMLALDPNADGRLTPAELREVVTSLFKSVDANGDGVISLTESQTFFMSNRGVIGGGGDGSLCPDR